MLPGVPGWFLAVSRRINDPVSPVILRRQLNRIGVVKAGHHHISILANGIIRIHVVVVEGVGSNSHLVVAVDVAVAIVGWLCGVAVGWVSSAVTFDCCTT